MQYLKLRLELLLPENWHIRIWILNLLVFT